MAARGSVAKTLIGTAILQVFPGSFIDSDQKTIRIPTSVEGEPLEIKITMTCAKDIIGSGQAGSIATTKQAVPQNTEMTDAEIQEVRELIARLGL
jgi:hypothetical protein